MKGFVRALLFPLLLIFFVSILLMSLNLNISETERNLIIIADFIFLVFFIFYLSF